jgi:hypothetical protein
VTLRRKAFRLVLLTAVAGLLVAPAKTWLQERDTELAYRFVEAHEPLARSLTCSCGCKDLAHESLADCFLYRGDAKTRNPHAET